MGAITLKRQTSTYNPKEHKVKEGLKDMTYSVGSGLEKSVNSTKSLTTQLITGLKATKQIAQNTISDPGSLLKEYQSIFQGNLTMEKRSNFFENKLENNEISKEEYGKSQDLYEVYRKGNEKNALYKANLIKSDEEYQAYVGNRDINLWSPKRITMALTREVTADLTNPYQLAVDFVGGKAGMLVGSKMAKYGKWAGVGAELTVSAGTAGTANVVESFSYGKRSPKELTTDFALGATFGLMLSGGSRGFNALKNKAFSSLSNKVDDAANKALEGVNKDWNIDPQEATNIISKQAEETAMFYNDTPAGQKINKENITEFNRIQKDNASANQIQYGVLTDNILDGRFPADDELSKMLQYEYEPNSSYGVAKDIVSKNPDAITRLNQWLNETPENLKILSDLPDEEILKIAPGINGQSIRELQTLKTQILSDFDNIDAQFNASGMEDYNFTKFLEDEYNFTGSERLINIDQIGTLKTMKEPNSVDNIFNSHAYLKDDALISDPDGLNFNTLQKDLPEDLINKRMNDRVNVQNENISAYQESLKASNPELITADEYASWGKKLENLTDEDKLNFKKFAQNCGF